MRNAGHDGEAGACRGVLVAPRAPCTLHAVDAQGCWKLAPCTLSRAMLPRARTQANALLAAVLHYGYHRAGLPLVQAILQALADKRFMLIHAHADGSPSRSNDLNYLVWHLHKLRQLGQRGGRGQERVDDRGVFVAAARAAVGCANPRDAVNRLNLVTALTHAPDQLMSAVERRCAL